MTASTALMAAGRSAGPSSTRVYTTRVYTTRVYTTRVFWKLSEQPLTTFGRSFVVTAFEAAHRLSSDKNDREDIMSSNETLGYDVFVSDPIPQNVTGLLPNGEPHMFSPLATTLIYGKKDAVLVDPPLTTEQAKAVGDWVEASGKKLTHVFATHDHGDHWFTADVLAKRFGEQVVASAGTIGQMRFHVSIREGFWDKLWPGQIPPSPVTAVTTPTTPDNRFTLEGHDLIIVEVGHSDTDESTVVYVPDLDLVVAGDVIYNGVHQYPMYRQAAMNAVA